MFVLKMGLTGVNSNILLIFFLSITLFSKEIEIHEVNKIENITLSNGSSITQGGLIIINSKTLTNIEKNCSESNNSISQGVILIEDENITDIHYDIVNIITYTP